MNGRFDGVDRAEQGRAGKDKVAENIGDGPGEWPRGGLTGCARRLWDAIEDPKYWGRADDQRKTLPDQWARLHSRWRYVSALVPYLGPPIHTMRNIFWPVAAIMGLCVGIELCKGRVAWGLDEYNNFGTLFRYSSFVLSLLLAFRLNRTYDRWWQARCAFGGIGGGIVNLVRQVATWTDDPVLIRQYQKWGMCVVYGVVQLINEAPKTTDPRVREILDPEELALYESTTKPSKLAGTMLSALTARAGFEVNREVYLNEMMGHVAGHVAMVARIKLQCMPTAMSMFCTGWTFVWLLLLPFGFFPEANWSALLPVFMMAAMMLGLDDVANQLEDPFKFFPYEAMVATTAKDMPRTVREVQASKAMIEGTYVPMTKDPAAAAALPPWPQLPARRQKRT